MILMIPDFVDESKWFRVAHDPKAHVVDLMWMCPRMNEGKELTWPVTLHTEEVLAIAVGCVPADPFVRPSSLPAAGRPSWKTLLEVDELSVDDFEINSHFVEEELRSGMTLHTPHGKESALWECPFLLTFSVPGEAVGIASDYRALIAIGCERFSVLEEGHPLPFEVWYEQFEEWVDSFDEVEESGSEVVGGETPEGIEAFTLVSDDVPEALLLPLRKRFEGHVSGDWVQMAEAYTSGEDVEVAAAEYEAWLSGEGWGRWGAVQRLVSWWQEGNRAMVHCAGVEYVASAEGGSATTQDAEWHIALQKDGDDWFIMEEKQLSL
jgi:hypothetical protein